MKIQDKETEDTITASLLQHLEKPGERKEEKGVRHCTGKHYTTEYLTGVMYISTTIHVRVMLNFFLNHRATCCILWVFSYTYMGKNVCQENKSVFNLNVMVKEKKGLSLLSEQLWCFLERYDSTPELYVMRHWTIIQDESVQFYER